MNIEKTLNDLLLRVKKLEQATFGRQEARTAAPKDFKGATGGLRFLISKGFFDQKRVFSQIEMELEKRGYHYSKQAIQTPLNNLSKKGGPLVGFKMKGKKAYAKRK